MAANPYREQLIAQATNLQRGATRKISRLKTKVDVVVAGTEYDVRKPPRTIKRLTTRQLEVHISRLQQFNSRSTQFVPDAHRRPIPAAEFKEYKTAEKMAVKNAQDVYNSIKDIMGSSGTETLGQRREKMRSDRKLAGNPTVQDPYSPRVRDPKNIANRQALKKLTKDEKRRSERGWEDRELNRQIGEFGQMISRIADPDMESAVRALTPGQFRVLWNDTNFPTALGQKYEIKQLLVAGKDKPWFAEVLDNAFADIWKEINWAKKLDL